MDISVVISLYNERESLQELVKGIGDAIAPTGLTYNIIMVNDGSTDGSWELIKEMAKTNSHIKGICFRKNYGKSAALYHGFEEADGEVVITMDADLQDDPREIPALYDMIMKDGYDLVSGWKKKRYDSKLTKNLPSKLYNATARKVTGIKLHDMASQSDIEGCGYALSAAFISFVHFCVISVILATPKGGVLNAVCRVFWEYPSEIFTAPAAWLENILKISVFNGYLFP